MSESPTRTPLVLRPVARRRAGLVMQAVAVVGLVAALVGTASAWRLVGRFDATVGDSLVLTGETLVTLEETIGVAEELVGSIDAALALSVTALADVATTIESTSEVIDEVDAFSDEVGPALTDAVATLEGLAEVARTVDGVLGQLDALPFGPDYDPDVPLGTRIDELARDLGPVADATAALDGDLGTASASAAELVVSLSEFADAVDDVRADVAGSESVLSGYRAAADRAGLLADGIDADLDQNIATTRILLVIVGVAVAVGQIVPFWVGRELVLASRHDERLA